jgi:hypothetical protein
VSFWDHPAERWSPVRFVPRGVTCGFCRVDIPAGSPGRTRGTRGTRAYYNAHRRIYECIGCRTEGIRAEEAGRAEELLAQGGAR